MFASPVLRPRCTPRQTVLSAALVMLVACSPAGAAERAAATDAEASRMASAAWLLFATLVSLEQEGPSQSWRWLDQEIGLGPEHAGTLLAYGIESLAALSRRADALHARNCAMLTTAEPSLEDIAAALERTNAELDALRRERVAGLRDVLPGAAYDAVLELVRAEFAGAVETVEFDFRSYLEATGQPPAALVREMCE